MKQLLRASGIVSAAVGVAGAFWLPPFLAALAVVLSLPDIYRSIRSRSNETLAFSVVGLAAGLGTLLRWLLSLQGPMH
jgi:hypothetical protein